MDLYTVCNCSALHPDLGVQFFHIMEGQCLAISKHGIHDAIQTEHDL